MVRYAVPLAAGKLWPLAAGKLWPLAAGKLWPLAAGKLWPLAAGYLWPLGGRESPPRWSSHGSSPPAGHLTDMPWGAPWSSHGFALGGPLVISRMSPRDPRLPVAILGELERIPEEVSGWNGSELNSERIHVRFSRIRRWNAGGWPSEIP